MILGIDLRCLPADGSDGAGIAHASRAIASALASIVPSDCAVKLYIPNGARIKTQAERVVLSGSRRSHLFAGLRASPCDLLFVPSGAVPVGLPVPAIPWVHDLDIFEHPAWFPQSWFMRIRTTWMFRRGLVRAPMIFCVSEYTKRQAERLLSHYASRKISRNIWITGEGGDESLLHITDAERAQAKVRLEKFGISGRFLLVLGTIEPRKNIPFILSLLPFIPPVNFVIAGRDGWKTDMIKREIASASATYPIVRLQTVSDEMRRDLLLSAALVLLPSFSEGFGLVALEGMQAGVPVLASDRGALPEVAGNSILPLDRAAWSATISHIVNEEEYKHGWLKKQLPYASKHSWKHAAEIIWKGIHNFA